VTPKEVETLRVWKWIAGSMAALLVSNAATAWVAIANAKVTDDHIVGVVESRFTDISQGRGMYAIEGRGKIDGVALLLTRQGEKLDDVLERLVRLETKIDRAGAGG